VTGGVQYGPSVVARALYLHGYQLLPYARAAEAANDEAGILASYGGTCVHDGWLSYTHYPGCRHALCGAHLRRELTYFEELSEVTKAWAAPLKELLLEMKGVSERDLRMVKLQQKISGWRNWSARPCGLSAFA